MVRCFICALFMISFVANAQLRDIPDEFADWLKSDGMFHATVAMEVSRLSQDAAPEIIYSYDSERMVQPASLMKLVTTSAALSLLGADKTVKTEVFYTGEVEDGILKGDLIIKGYGNAMLASARSLYPKDTFQKNIIVALKSKGINSIEGNIVGDGSLLTESAIPSDWPWEDMGTHYAQSISGLNYEDNKFDVVLDTRQKGAKPSIITVEPEVDGLTIENQLLPLNYASDSAYLHGGPFQRNRMLVGAVPHRLPQHRVKADVPDPAQFTASRIKTALVEAGIKVAGNAVSVVTQSKDNLYSSLPVYKGFGLSVEMPEYDKATLLYTNFSEPLSFMIKQTNVFSINIMAEMMLRQIALAEGNGSETEGIARVKTFLDSLDIDRSGLMMFDGCGLATTDRVTARFMNTLLDKMKNNEVFFNSLAIAGKSGTVASFLANTRLAGKAHLKTGTTKTVIAYSGYIEGNDGVMYAATIIVNNYTCMTSVLRKNIEKQMLLLIP